MPRRPKPSRVPWGLPFHAGDKFPVRPQLPEGIYRLAGKATGSARVQIEREQGDSAHRGVTITYDHYSDDGVHILDGTESADARGKKVIWHSKLELSGCETGSKISSEPDGFVIGDAGFDDLGQKRSGTLTTTINGKQYISPPEGQ